MSTALGRAALELEAELAKHQIKVDGEERMIVWRDVIVPVHFGTTRVECRQILNKLIRDAIETERKETQATLL